MSGDVFSPLEGAKGIQYKMIAYPQRNPTRTLRNANVQSLFEKEKHKRETFIQINKRRTIELQSQAEICKFKVTSWRVESDRGESMWFR